MARHTGASDIGRVGLGGSIRYEAQIQNNLSWTCGLMYSSYFDRIQDGYPTGNKINSIANGLKYYFKEPCTGYYAAVDIGMTLGSGNRGSFSPGLGYRTDRWDFTGRLNVISDANNITLRAAYVFHVK